MKRRYFVLRAFSLILRILGWIGVIVGLVLFVVGLVELLRSSSDVANMLIARDVLGGGIGLVITGLILVLYGELIEVFFDIEANTRRTAETIAETITRLAAAPPSPPS